MISIFLLFISFFIPDKRSSYKIRKKKGIKRRVGTPKIIILPKTYRYIDIMDEDREIEDDLA